MPAPIALSPVPAGPHWPLKIGTLEPRVAPNGCRLGLGDLDGLGKREFSLPSRLEAIPCSEDHDVSHRPVASVLVLCDPSRFGDLILEFLAPSGFPLVAEVLEGYLLGIEDAPRRGEVDGVRLGVEANGESCPCS